MFDRILPALSGFPLRPMLAAACLTASLSVSSPAAAAVVQNSFARGSIDVTLDRPDQAGQAVRVGGCSGMLDGVSFLSYCIDLAQHFTFGTVYTDAAPGGAWQAVRPR